MKIGELAQVTQCSIDTIRYYEKIDLILPPERTAGNFRLYNAEHISQLLFIRYCRTLDISLDEIKMLLGLKADREQDTHKIQQLIDKHLQQVSARIHELEHLRIELLKLKGQSHILHYHNHIKNTELPRPLNSPLKWTDKSS